MPNLVIEATDVSVSPAFPEAGEMVSIAVRVRNTGERTSPASLLELALGDPRQGGGVIGVASVPPLGVASEASVSLSWDSTGQAGSRTLFAIVDPRFEVAESDELDNAAQVAVTVDEPGPAGPDFTVSSLVLTPSRLSELPAGIEARVAIRNRGHSPADGLLVVDDGGAQIADARVQLPPRASATIVLPFTVYEPGTRILRAIADPANAVPEEDETDNTATATLFDPGDSVDLSLGPADLVPTPTELVVGETLTVAATIWNRGTARAPQVPIALGRYEGTAFRELARVSADMEVGFPTTVELSWRTGLVGDPLDLVVRVDPFGNVREASEANNEAAFQVRVLDSDRPNLAVPSAGVELTPATPLEGQSATITAEVRNLGAVASGPFSVGFFIGEPGVGGVPLASVAVPDLGPGASTTLTVPWSPVDTRGSAGLFVTADTLGQVDEYDESDNRGFRPFRAIALPDLVIDPGAVVLDPSYPPEGDPVEVRLLVRNLGGQPAAATTVTAYEVEPFVGLALGDLAVPELAPGAAVELTLSWLPASPPGVRTLSLAVDPPGAVIEMDEGNNVVRRTVLVQDGDLFFSSPVFSPDGDGALDDTVVGYRATTAVRVEISDEAGRLVRTLLDPGPAEGSVAWDGRDGHGLVVRDGSYTVSVVGEGNLVVAQSGVEVDTDRSLIFEAAGTGRTAIQRLPCSLPTQLTGPAWLPSEQGALYVVPGAGAAFPPGLLQVNLDGTYEYRFQDAWYASAEFAVTNRSGPGPVSPNGLEVLLGAGGRLFVVSLVDGSRLELPVDTDSGDWSPDGRHLAVGTQLLTRTGELVAEPPGYWRSALTWAPSARRLAAVSGSSFEDGGNSFDLVELDQDGVEQRRVFLMNELAETRNWHALLRWRADGKIAVELRYDPVTCAECSGRNVFVVDAEQGTRVELTQQDAERALADWSPTGSRVLFGGAVSLADGSGPVAISELDVQASPRASLAFTRQAMSGGCSPGSRDTLVVANLLNLRADLKATRLPGNAGILLRGTASDGHLDRHDLAYAEAGAPETWRPIGAGSETPVVDGVFTTWVPPAPGNYLLRLRVLDQAGHAATRTQAVAWDSAPPLVNVSPSEFLISPNGDGVRDTVTFSYLVLDPVVVDVQASGPEDPEAPANAPPVVRAFTFNHPSPGPASFIWDGRDESAQAVTDGTYTVTINGAPFRIGVDATPPEIGLRYENPQVIARPAPNPGPCQSVAQMGADALRHVVDGNLKAWWIETAGGAPLTAPTSVPVFVPELGPGGGIRLDGRGLPIAKRTGGVPDDVRTLESPRLARDARLVAEDFAGNRATAAIGLLDEVLLTGDAWFDAGNGLCERTFIDGGPEVVHPLAPETSFALPNSLRLPGAQWNRRFHVQPRSPEGAPWLETHLRKSGLPGARARPVRRPSRLLQRAGRERDAQHPRVPVPSLPGLLPPHVRREDGDRARPGQVRVRRGGPGT
jgi:subtilase family serine protease